MHCEFGPVPQMSTGRPSASHMGSKTDEICILGLKSLHTPLFVYILLKGMKNMSMSKDSLVHSFRELQVYSGYVGVHFSIGLKRVIFK